MMVFYALLICLATPLLIVTEFMENGSLDKYLKVKIKRIQYTSIFTSYNQTHKYFNPYIVVGK